jgi:Leucine-rich repeat (LRR) protein
MPPEIPLRSQFDYISEHIIVNLSRQRDLTKIVYLNLFNNKIKRITNLEGLPNLTTLILSFNEIEEIEGLNNNT